MSDFIYGRQPVVEALRSGLDIEKILLARGTKPAAVLDEIRSRAADRGIALHEEDRHAIGRYAPGRTHQGVLAFVKPFEYADLNDVLGAEELRLVLLDGVTDPANLGSILRSAEAFGFTGVLVPRHRAVGVTPAVRKVSAGAAHRVPVALISSPADAVRRLSREGVQVVGLDARAESRYDEVGYERDRVCLVVGSEGRGLSRLTRDRCDLLVAIPMTGAMSSVNVAVAAAVVMVEVTRSHRLDNS